MFFEQGKPNIDFFSERQLQVVSEMYRLYYATQIIQELLLSRHQQESIEYPNMSTYADGVLYRIYNLDDKTDVTYHKREKGGGHMWIGYLSISSKDIYKITVGVAQTSEEAKDQMHNPPLEFQYYSGAVVYSDPGIRDFTLGMACAAIKAFQQNGISPINQAV